MTGKCVKPPALAMQGGLVEERKQGVDIVGEQVKRFGDGGIAHSTATG